MPGLLVTVFADASFRSNGPPSKDGAVAGLGWYFKSHHMGRHGSGTAVARTVPHAEILALLAGARAAIQAHGEPVDLLLQSDSMAALGAFVFLKCGTVAKTSIPVDKRKALWKVERACILDFLCEFPTVRIWLKHVKGHNGRADARSYINQCNDRAAKEARLRAEFGQEAST